MEAMRAGRGHTLIELLIFLLAALIVSGAVVGVATETFRGEVAEMRAEGPRASAQLAAQAITNSLFSATALVSPAQGLAGSRLEGYIGRMQTRAAPASWISAATGDASGPYDRFLFCLDARGRLFFYRNTNPTASADPSAIVCGNAGGQILSGTGSVVGRFGGSPFSRPAGAGNIVQVAFDMRDAKKKSDPEPVDLRITLQRGVAAP